VLNCSSEVNGMLASSIIGGGGAVISIGMGTSMCKSAKGMEKSGWLR